ncbi:outer membrane lipoprotein-sorting protein [Fodinibius roseus]|uniref:Outer membrane lipoprotein-sorting protein n=1 Tax=Fodinibius roseus TaxID=1194090 RepID=A0A1M5JDE4_9BACT|nr:outer membrane lipoprotein-sorting protein [Fodinibius roseus]SHG38548.1 outer membrane lipoprotein-sorting protein [Fodinibius roseus]
MFTKPFAFALFLFVLFGGLAFLQPVQAQNATAILAKVDSVQNAFSDMTANEQMIITDASGSQKERTLRINQKGSELRMVRFLEPADVRGVGFLRVAADRLYLYLPAFRRVRRIASSAKNENFMGTDFTYEDMSQSVYADDYTARELSTQQGQYRLFLEPKPGADVNYHHLVILADTSNYVLRKVEFYDREEEKIKELTIDNIEKIDGYWMGKTMRMVSLDDNHETVLELSDIRFDQGLSDSDFTERMLKRPIR